MYNKLRKWDKGRNAMPGFFGRYWNDDFFTDFFDGNSMPAINVKETDKDYKIEVSAPGFKKEDFTIEIDNNILKISANKNYDNSNGMNKNSDVQTYVNGQPGDANQHIASDQNNTENSVPVSGTASQTEGAQPVTSTSQSDSSDSFAAQSDSSTTQPAGSVSQPATEQRKSPQCHRPQNATAQPTESNIADNAGGETVNVQPKQNNSQCHRPDSEMKQNDLNTSGQGLQNSTYGQNIQGREDNQNIQGRGNNQNEKVWRQEFSYSSFSRSFSLPENIDTDNIKATQEHGILEITIPKLTQNPDDKVKKIQIN